MEVPLAGGAVPGERGGDARLTLELGGEGEAVGDRQHGSEVADHAHDALFPQPEMERAVATLRESAILPEELAEETAEVDPPGGEDAEVAVHGKDPVVRVQRGGNPDRDRLLPHPGEPLREPPLPEQQQGLFLHEPGQQQRPVELLQALRGKAGHFRRGGRRGAGNVAHATDFISTYVGRQTVTAESGACSHGRERSGIHSREASRGSGGCAASTPQLNEDAPGPEGPGARTQR